MNYCHGIGRRWLCKIARLHNRGLNRAVTDLPKDIAKKRQELEQVSSQIPALTARVEEMQGRVDKLANEEKQRELTSAKVKRLRTYRSRLADRVGELRAARDELSFLTAQIEEKQKLVTALEGRADQAEHEATTATEALHKAQQAGEVAELGKSQPKHQWPLWRQKRPLWMKKSAP